MPFSIPGLDGLHDLLVADFASRFPEKDVSRFGDNWTRLRVLALGIMGLHYHAQTVETDLWPDTASGLDSVPPSPMLDRHGFIRGVLRKPATAAYKKAAFRATGTIGTPIPINTELTHKDGTIYIVTAGNSIGAGGYVDLDLAGDARNYPVVTEGVGAQTRKQIGEVLTFVSPPAGIQAAGVFVLALDNGGADRERDSAYRARILDKIASPGMGGNAEDYRAWALDQPGVDEAYVYPLRNGYGSVDIACLHSGSGSARLLSDVEIAAVQAAIDKVRPISMKMFRVLTVTAQLLDVEIKIDPIDGPEFAFDWLDVLPAQVSAWDAATRVLTFVARPPLLDAGMRLVVKNTGTKNDGSELVVESLGPGAQDCIVTAESLTAANLAAPPEAGARITSGGPLVEPLREGVVELADSLGPGRGTDPVKVAGRWDDTFRVSSMFKVTQLAEGVLETYPVAPTSNVVAANNPPDATVGLVCIRQVIIRKA